MNCSPVPLTQFGNNLIGQFDHVIRRQLRPALLCFQAKFGRVGPGKNQERDMIIVLSNFFEEFVSGPHIAVASHVGNDEVEVPVAERRKPCLGRGHLLNFHLQFAQCPDSEFIVGRIVINPKD